MVDYSAYHWAKKAQYWAESIGSALIYRGSVATYADLPSSDQKVGDMWNVLADGANYAWDGTAWDALSGVVDLSAYRTSADQDLIDAGKQPTLTTGTGINISSANVISVTSPTLTNVSTGTSSLSVLGAATVDSAATSIGVDSTAGTNGTSLGRSANSVNGGLAIGTYSKASGSWSTAVGNGNSLSNAAEATASGAIALGHNAHSTASNAIQIFEGTNSTADSLQVKTYELLDTSTGIIPDARISTNIARTSAIPTDYVTTNTAQTISQSKAFSSPLVVADGVGLATGTILSNKKILQKTASGIEVGNSTEDVLLIGNSATVRPKYNGNDLALKSDVPTNNNQLTNGAGYATLTDVANDGYTKNVGTVTSVNNTSPDVDGNVSLSIPTVNDSTITITQGGVTKGSFTLNQASGDTIALDAGGGLPSQTGNSGKFLTTDGTDASWGVPKTFNILDYKWTDYELNDQNWLNANTFSWQDGTVYSDAYNHLEDDYTNGTSTSETVGSYTITYVLADDGHKITTDETTVANIYNESGVAWYYILDTVNQRFKLPRENPAREELISLLQAPVKGNGITLGMTDGTNLFGVNLRLTGATARGLSPDTNIYGSPVGSSSTTSTAGNTNTSIGLTTDATKSGIVADLSNSTSTSVYKGKKYLYFYVGQFSQSATEQTAGLNSSLFNGKVDLDLGNVDNTNNQAANNLNIKGIRTIVETYQNGDDWYRLYSDGWCEQGGKASSSSRSVNLLKAFSSNNYNICLLPNTGSGTVGFSVTGTPASDSFSFAASQNPNNGFFWNACGYTN